jgi:hypothetical protein
MHPQLRHFVLQLATAIVGALAPVVFTAFVSVPLNLQGHPGEPRVASVDMPSHMT